MKMTWKEMIEKRQWANERILEVLKDDPWIKENFDFVKRMIKQYPDQRFGQIICNYICPSYRDYNPIQEEIDCMARLFPGGYDPFYEESVETLNRLMGED